MSAPAPVKLVNRIIERSTYPVLATGAVIFVPLILIYVLTGAIYPDTIEPWSVNPLEITGLLIMLAVLPAYLLMCFVALTRTNNATFEFHNARLPDQDLSASRYRYGGYWILAVIAALAFGAFFNIGWFSLSFEFSDPRFFTSVSIVLGQLFLWLIVGAIIYLGINEGIAFHTLGKKVPIDLYHLDELNGFGRAGLNSFFNDCWCLGNNNSAIHRSSI